MKDFGSGAFCFLKVQCHPEHSRFSGGAKDLPLKQLRASAKLHHYQDFDLLCVSVSLW